LILLDENSLRSQREFLEARRLPVRKVGLDWGRAGMTDREILTKLRDARHVTFFTRDADFHRRSFCHPAYCLVVIALQPSSWPLTYAVPAAPRLSGRTRSGWQRSCGCSLAASSTGYETIV
jgi:hypothetical protein